MRRYLRLRCCLRLAVLGLLGLEFLHPLFHHLEGGSLDVLLTYAHVWAGQAQALVPMLSSD